MGLDQFIRRLALTGEGGWPKAVAAAAVCLAAATLLRVALTPVLGAATGYIIFYPAVVLAAVWGGRRAALLALPASAGLAVLVSWLASPDTFDPGRTLLNGVLYITTAAAVSALGVSLRASLRQLDASLATERAALAAHDRERRRLQLAQEAGGLGAWEWDLETDGLTVSDGYRRNWRSDIDETVPFLELARRVHPEDYPVVLEARRRTMEEGQPYYSEYRVEGPDGVRWLVSRGEPVRNAEGRPVRVFGVNRDVTDQKRREQDLRASEERFRLFTEAAPVMLWMSNPEGACTHLNKAHREFWGVADDLSGFDWMSTLHPDDAAGVGEIARAAYAARTPFASEARFRRADGAWRVLETTARPYYDGDGGFVGMIGVNVDVTDARRAEAALRESEARFRAMADTAPVQVWTTDATGEADFVNRVFREYFGGERPEGAETVHPQDRPRVLQAFRDALAAQTGYEVQTRIRRHDGEWRWHITRAEPRHDADGRFAGFIGVSIDVHEARVATEALRESEQRFRAMADSAPAPVWVTGADSGIEFGNQALLDFFGGDPGQVLGRRWIEHLHRDDLESVLTLREAAQKAHAPFTFEARFRNGAGEWRWLRASTSPRFGADGEFLGYVGIAFDVTDAREATEALRREEQRHLFLLNLNDTIRDLEDPSAIMAAATGALGRHLGVARVGYGEIDDSESHVEMSAVWTDGSVSTAAGVYLMDDFGPQLSRDLKARRTVQVADVQTDPLTAESRAAFEAMQTRAFLRVPLARGGRLRSFLYLHSPVVRPWTDGDRELAEEVAERTWAAVERARAEAEVRESEARFRSIADSAPVLIWVTRADRRRAFVNQAYVEFYGGTYEEARDADWRQLLHPEDVEATLQASLAGEATRLPFMLEARYRRHDGQYRWLRSYSRPRLDVSGELMGFVGVAYDVTEARQVESDLKHINELLEERVDAVMAEKARAEAALMHAQKMEAVGRLTGGVAHDFNNLLTVVIGALDMMLRAPDDAARQKRLGEAALSAARRGERLTHQLLAFSRRQALRPEACDLAAVVRECEPLLRRAVGEAIALGVEVSDSAARARLDPSQFEAALLNLVVNARDATADGGAITISVRPCTLEEGQVAETPAGDYVSVSVQDEGQGMSPEVLERIFEPFFTTKPVGKGTGLGLSQVYGFARQSGGGVSVDSRPGEGSTVTLYLPALAGADPSPPSPVRAERTRASFAGRRVLLVEDDAGVAEVAESMLHELGFDVERACDAAEALQALEQQACDLLLTDVIMPGGMNGVELAQRASTSDPRLRVLLTSGYVGEAMDAAVGDAAWPLLRKPYAEDALAAALEAVFAEPEPVERV